MRSGVDRETGKVLTGWDHCLQSIACVLTTAPGTLLMARDFGSDVPGMIDQPGSAPQIARVTMAIATALGREEKAFRLRQVKLLEATAAGVFTFELAGDFYPEGHRGDFSIVEQVAGPIALTGAYDVRPA